ncbi:MAG: DNA recombination protein RmuC [Bacteriovoracaceae bacterium]|nr:DNA recombination protein RmuC [Bacteriovoracaceae bacterium]
MIEFAIGFTSGAVLSAIIAIVLFKTLSKAQRSEFEKIAQSSMDINTLNSQETLESMLSPFKERLMEYQKAVESYNAKGIENTATLKNEMEHVVQATQKIELEAANMSKALKGDVKVQGNWGEMILEKILQTSGFVEGREYSSQGRGQGYKDEHGNVFRPDVVIHFPDGANIVVDSKVSLVHYERYVSSEDAERPTHLKSLHGSVKKHIDDLSSKKYHALEGVESPEFVMLFIPIESVFSIIMSQDSTILDYAWKKRIALVTPVSFMAVLKTVQGLWKVERQNQNAKDIAKKAGLLYDKFFVFYEELSSIQSDFNKTQDRFEKSFGRLKDGKGNLLGRIEELKELGADTSK